ncbi:preprotein translocase subunit TatB [Achromobacter sp. 413638]|uniref:preprotein translocase subunit TatB n=1 Tax=Achromobacter sp. 413638 TaxID=3342385 RepID=UPI00370B2EF6
MFFKILVLLAVAAGLVYLIRQPRRGQAAGAFHAAPARRKPAFVALCVGAALSLLASLMSAVLWMGAVAGGVTGGGYRGQADYLLPVAGCLLALAVACAVGAFFKRRG